jgi:hypothetical protein
MNTIHTTRTTSCGIGTNTMIVIVNTMIVIVNTIIVIVNTIPAAASAPSPSSPPWPT